MGKPSYSGGVFAPWDGSFTLDTFSIMSISPSTALGMRRETSSSWGSRAAVPNLLALRFVKMVFPWTGAGGWFWDDSSTLYLFCTLFHDRDLGVAYQTRPGNQASSRGEAKNSAVLLSRDG